MQDLGVDHGAVDEFFKRQVADVEGRVRWFDRIGPVVETQVDPDRILRPGDHLDSTARVIADAGGLQQRERDDHNTEQSVEQAGLDGDWHRNRRDLRRMLRAGSSRRGEPGWPRRRCECS